MIKQVTHLIRVGVVSFNLIIGVLGIRNKSSSPGLYSGNSDQGFKFTNGVNRNNNTCRGIHFVQEVKLQRIESGEYIRLDGLDIASFAVHFIRLHTG